MRLETWEKLIRSEMAAHGESFNDFVGSTFKGDEAQTSFDASYGSPEGAPFTLWTTKRVYFPICYDGRETVGSAPRDPCPERTEHLGGW